MKSCRHRQKTRDANITDGNWAPFCPEWVAVARLWKWQHNVLPTLSLTVRMALPAWGLLSIFFLGKATATSSHWQKTAVRESWGTQVKGWCGQSQKNPKVLEPPTPSSLQLDSTPETHSQDSHSPGAS